MSSESRSQPNNAIIIAVMGPTGAGKSSFIKAATGVDVQIGESLSSCTQDIQAVWCKHPTRDCDVCFVDTPGFDDTYKDDTQILELIANWLLKTYQAGTKLSGVLYLHSITANRMPHSAVRTLDIFQKICGRDAFSTTGLVTTHWDHVASQPGYDATECEKKEKDLCETFWKPLVDLGSKPLRFHNTHISAWDVVRSLPLEQKVLLIQREMGDEHLRLSETTAGRTLLSWLFRAASSLKEAIERIVNLLAGSSSTSADDNSSIKYLEQEKAKANEELNGIKTQLDSQSLRRNPLLHLEHYRSRKSRSARETTKAGTSL